VPTLLSDAIADAHVQAAVQLALADPALAPVRNQTCLAIARGTRTIFEWRADEPVAPASNLKLLTTTAALARLGSDADYTTDVRVGTDGRLWLIGGGDPMLMTADFVPTLAHRPAVTTSLEALADSVVRAGLTSVSGVMGDEGRYDQQRYIPTWRKSYITEGESGPLSALSVNHGFVHGPAGWTASAHPATDAAGVFALLLAERGVAIHGPIGEGKVPTANTRPVASIHSAPLRAIVDEILTNSDNQGAEMLLKELGYRFGGAGTTAAGIVVEHGVVNGLDQGRPSFAVVDGSGLDRSDRVDCNMLLDALEAAGPTSPIADGLPVAGQTGTLATLYKGTPVAGKLHAKTGTLNDVSALSGFVQGRDGSWTTFSLVVDGIPPGSRAAATLQQRVATILVNAPDAPAPAELAP
jgi:D-alanyl-D-alanine carboxypeptidase/D-alanyl-D-alanine-endopeptidase (penicillin-binding protein 4)